MSFELFFQTSLIFSGFGLLAVVTRKFPELLKVSDRKIRKKEINLIAKFQGKAKAFLSWKGFSYDLFLQKLLSRIRILTLKTDNQTVNWLQKLREKTQNKLKEGSNYWEEIKKSKGK